jgi:hypothetical protein
MLSNKRARHCVVAEGAQILACSNKHPELEPQPEADIHSAQANTFG